MTRMNYLFSAVYEIAAASEKEACELFEWVCVEDEPDDRISFLPDESGFDVMRAVVEGLVDSYMSNGTVRAKVDAQTERQKDWLQVAWLALGRKGSEGPFPDQFRGYPPPIAIQRQGLAER